MSQAAIVEPRRKQLQTLHPSRLSYVVLRVKICAKSCNAPRELRLPLAATPTLSSWGEVLTSTTRDRKRDHDRGQAEISNIDRG